MCLTKTACCKFLYALDSTEIEGMNNDNDNDNNQIKL